MKEKIILCAVSFVATMTAFICGMTSVFRNGNELVILCFILLAIGAACVYVVYKREED